MDKKETEGTPTESRRNFLQAGGMALLGLAMPESLPAKPRPSESLALSGGPKAVSFPKDKLEALTIWPRYGQPEKDALHRLIDTDKFYEELPLFEKEWQAYTGIPYLRAHINGSSAITSMFFAIDLEPGSEVMVPSYDFPVGLPGDALLQLCSHLHRYSVPRPDALTWKMPGASSPAARARCSPCIPGACPAKWTTFATSPRRKI